MTRPEEHAPRDRAVGDRADRLAVFLRHAADARSSGSSPQQQTRSSRSTQAQPARSPQAPARRRHAGAPGARAAASRPGRRRRRAAIARETGARRDAARRRSRRRALKGSIALKGARIDDLALTKYRETVDPNSPPIVLLSPSGTPASVLRRVRLGRRRRHRRQAARAPTPCGAKRARAALGVGQPVTLIYDNGEGLEFRRTIAVDDNYLFTVKDRSRTRAPRRSRSIPMG